MQSVKMLPRITRTVQCCIIIVLSASVISASITTTKATTVEKIKTSESADRFHLSPEFNLFDNSTTGAKHQFLNQTLKATSKKYSPLTGNELWDGLINECLSKPSYACIQKNVYSYLSDSLKLENVNVTNRLFFKKNRVDFQKYTKEFNEEWNEIESGRSDDTPIEEVTSSLYGKSVKFMMTHDVELKMPEMMFDGARFKISPRSIEGNGAIVKIEFLPKVTQEMARELQVDSDKGTPRIFFKKIKKFFKNKLLLAFFAIILIIKIVKIKLFWVLPLIVGAATAKKLVLKLLLFVFPALAHIFKLCSYYHHNYHQTKFHHHQHHINHLHTVIGNHDEHHGGPPPYGAEVLFTNPPKGHQSEYLHGALPPPHSAYHAYGGHSYDHNSGPWDSAPYATENSEVHVSHFKPNFDDYKEISAWGLGEIGAHSQSSAPNANPYSKSDTSRVFTQKVAPPANLQQQGAAAQIAAQYSPQQLVEQQLRAQEQHRILQDQQLQQQLLNKPSFSQEPQILQPVNFVDPFYSPILTKIDKIFVQLGLNDNDEGCRERLVCSMYKNPGRYSPHSNYISAELSRDTSELQKPQSTNTAVLRFYRYVQSARDGQDQNDCLRLYPNCSVQTEKKKKKK